MARTHRIRTSAALAAGIVFCLGVAAAADSVAAEPPSADRASGGDAWQRQQPTRERVGELMEREGVRPSPAERRQELRTLNEVHRELMPPGTQVPAPGILTPNDRPERN